MKRVKILVLLVLLVLLGFGSYFLALKVFAALQVKGYSFLIRSNQPYDLVIKYSLIIDGSGENEPFRGDIALRDGVIVGVGYVNPHESPVFDAGGLTVIPRPVKLEKTPEMVEHLLSTSYPRYPAEEIILLEPPYAGLSLFEAAQAGETTPEEFFRQRLKSNQDSPGLTKQEKVLLLPFPPVTKDTKTEELLARLTRLRAEATGKRDAGRIGAGYRADLFFFKTRDYSRQELDTLLKKGQVPPPVISVVDGQMLSQ